MQIRSMLWYGLQPCHRGTPQAHTDFRNAVQQSLCFDNRACNSWISVGIVVCPVSAECLSVCSYEASNANSNAYPEDAIWLPTKYAS